MLGHLVPLGGGDPIPLPRKVMVLGRRSACDICLDYPNISSRHCELKLEGGYWRITDLQSRNGIKVNGERCQSKVVFPGDQISIAKTVFQLDYVATGEAPPPDVEENGMGMSLLEKAGLIKPERRPERKSNPTPQAEAPPAAPRVPKADRQPDDEIEDWLSDDPE